MYLEVELPTSVVASWALLEKSCGGCLWREGGSGPGDAVLSIVSCSISLGINEGVGGAMPSGPSDHGSASRQIVATNRSLSS